MIRSFLILTGLVGLLVHTGCRISINGGYVFDYQGVKAERNEIGDIDASVQKIVVENKFGDVLITRQADEPGWSWTGACWANESEEADRFLGDLKMSVTQSGDTQTWKIDMPATHRLLRGVRSDLEIRVPASVDVVTENKHGDTQVERTSGTVNVFGQHGDVKLTELVGYVKVLNQHGKVEAHGLASKADFQMQHSDSVITGTHGELNIISQHGDVTLENVGADVDANLQHGDLKASQVRSNIQFTASHGAVTLDMVGDQFNSIRGNATHSNVKISLPENCSPKVDANLKHGRIHSELKSDSKSSTSIKVQGRHTNVSLHQKSE